VLDISVIYMYLQVLTGHTGSVLCLQYDDRVIITGSSDSTVRYLVSCGQMHLYIIKCNGSLLCTEVTTEGVVCKQMANATQYLACAFYIQVKSLLET